MSLAQTLFSFRGEVGRKRYFFGTISSLLASCFIALLSTLIGFYSIDYLYSVEEVQSVQIILSTSIEIFVGVFLVYMTVCLSLKRLRDIGASPWLVLTLLLPYLNFLALLLLMVYPSRTNRN